MAETVSIVLEYLRRHNFMRAEAALRLEMQGRKVPTEPIFSLGREDLGFDLLSGEPFKEELSPYSGKIFPADESFHGDALDSDSKALTDKLVALDLQSQVWEPELASQGAASKRIGSLMPHKLIYERTEPCSNGSLESVSFATLNHVGIRPSPELDGGLRIQDIGLGISPDQTGLQRSKLDKQGIVPINWNNDTGISERYMRVQNEEEFRPQSTTSCNSSGVQLEPLEMQTRRMNCMVESVNQVRSSGDPFGQTGVISPLGMRPWEACNMSLQQRNSDFLQQDVGPFQLDKRTIVHESAELSQGHMSTSDTSKALENHYESFANSSYGVSMENGWLDDRRSSDSLTKILNKGMCSRSSQPFPFACPTSGNSSDQFEQQEIKQMVQGGCIHAYNRELRSVDFLKDLVLPWEVCCPNETDRLEGFEEAKACTNESKPEDLPRLPHVRVRSIDKNLDLLKGNSGTFDLDSTSDHGIANAVSETSFNLGSFLDIPVGQDVALSGVKQQNSSTRLSVSQGIVEDTPELLSGFATLGDEPSDAAVGYPQGYWDSDTYEDDEDPGYHRQPIEDEAWFLAHEIDYPSDDDRAKSNLEGAGSHSKKGGDNQEDDELSQIEEESYFSGEQFYKAGQSETKTIVGHDGASMTNFFGSSSQKNIVNLSQIRNMTYDGQLMDAEELNLMRADPVWQGFSSQANQLGLLSGEKSVEGFGKSQEEYSSDVDDEKQGSVRSSGAEISSDVADLGSEAKDSMLAAATSEWERESLQEQEVQGYQVTELMLGEDYTSQNFVKDRARHCSDFHVESNGALRCPRSEWLPKGVCMDRHNPENSISRPIKVVNGHPYSFAREEEEGCGSGFGGFSFPSPSSTCDLAASKADSGKSLWLTENILLSEDTDVYGTGIAGPDETLASWKRKSNDSSPILSPRGETFLNAASSVHSSVSAQSTDDSLSRATKEKEDEIPAYCNQDTDAMLVDDEEAAAVQEFRQVKAEEDEYEIFNLRIVHRKNRTGFEEEKNFPVMLNSVVAGRYLVTEYLGSAAFSKAIQARDLQTGMDVCMKIIKNNKDFFDQSLDEIKLLKFINKNDPADKYHILRLYDYFYYREHLFIVCELLRANLYEFHKFNRESGGEVYFTMSRLQSITRQCLEALEFLHNLGLIHCDLKPENILVKSYSRCEIKVIDLGSSCFQTDHLCPYVQSRSYRAPEVILGLPYNQKIDIWSLGCILAELCSGNVLFQNDSLATLLARVVGIIRPINPEMLAKGRDTHKYFTKNHMLYERNQDTLQLEYLLPKKTSLRHRLPMGDQGFVDFVGYLLQVNPENRPGASEALKHPWLSYPYEPISS